MTDLTDRVADDIYLMHTYGRLIAAAGYTQEELNSLVPQALVLLGGHIMHDKMVDAIAHSEQFTTVDNSFPELGLTGARDYDFFGALHTLTDEEKAAVRQRIGWSFGKKERP